METKMEQPKEYVIHNYSAIDKYNQRVEEKFKDSLQYNKLQRWKLLSVIAARLTAIILAVILSFSFCLWLWTQDLDGMVVIDYQTYDFNKLNDTFERIASVNEKLLDEKVSTELRLGQVRDAINAFSPGELGDVTEEFTVFRKRKIEDDKFVITGLVYLTRDLSSPEYEYCYLSESNEINPIKASREDIGYKINGKTMWQNPSSNNYELGLKFCEFTN